MVQFRQETLPHEQFVFFYIDVFGHSLNSREGQPWARGDEDDAVAKEAFQVSVHVTAHEIICLSCWCQHLTDMMEILHPAVSSWN